MHGYVIAAIVGFVIMSASSGFAEDCLIVPLLTGLTSDSATAAAPSAVSQTPSSQVDPVTRPRRPWPLPMLYGSSTFLNSYDAYLTLSAVNAGATEVNPVLKPFTNHPAAFIAVKAGLTAASIAGVEQMWKDNHRASAVVLMLLTNAMMVGITAHNAAVLQRVR
jgi:Domain of unknown function (DUF5658)